MDSEPQNYINQLILRVLKDEHEKFVSSSCESESINGNMKIVFQDRSVMYNKLLFIILNPEARKLIPSFDTESDLVIFIQILDQVIYSSRFLDLKLPKMTSLKPVIVIRRMAMKTK